METGMSRRGFIKVAGGAMAAAGLSGVASNAMANESQRLQVDSEMECDIVIVGAGAAGLAACVEAGEQGLLPSA